MTNSRKGPCTRGAWGFRRKVLVIPRRDPSVFKVLELFKETLPSAGSSFFFMQVQVSESASRARSGDDSADPHFGQKPVGLPRIGTPRQEDWF